MLSLRKKMIVLLAAPLLFISFGYAGETQPSQPVMTKTADVNKDGTPDVTYYGEGDHVTKVEADTNFDGMPDVVVHIKDGKFEIAQVDTDYQDGMDKEFTDEPAFKKWVNKERPDFADRFDVTGWDFPSIKF